MLVIDPHGSLYSAIVGWLAVSGIDHAKVVPFDLREPWVCALNIVRPRPGYDPAPLIHAAVRAILHGWKQADAEGLEWKSVFSFVDSKGEPVPEESSPFSRASEGQPRAPVGARRAEWRPASFVHRSGR